jgi:hypothetical protein
MDPSCRPVVALNNAGVALLKDGNVAASLEALHQALSLIRTIAAAHHSDSLNNDADSPQESTTLNEFRLLDCEDGAIFQFEANTFCSYNGSLAGDFYFYNAPLHVDALSNGTDSALHHTIIAILVFNTALAHHWLGRRTVSGSSSSSAASLLHHQKAARLYDVLLSMLHTATPQTDTCVCTNPVNKASFWAICKCVVLNNRSHIYYEDCDYVRSQACLQQMHTALVGQKASFLHQYLDAKVVMELRFNIWYMQGPRSTALAA